MLIIDECDYVFAWLTFVAAYAMVYQLPKVRLEIFSTLRDMIGQKSITFEFEGTTLQDLIQSLVKTYGNSVNQQVKLTTILINSKNIYYLKGVKTKISNNDVITFMPVVEGG